MTRFYSDNIILPKVKQIFLDLNFTMMQNSTHIAILNNNKCYFTLSSHKEGINININSVYCKSNDISKEVKEISFHTNFKGVYGISNKCEWTIKLSNDVKNIENKLDIVRKWLHKQNLIDAKVQNRWNIHIYEENPLFLQITSIFSNFNYQIERQIASYVIISKNNKRCFSLRIRKSLANIHINSKYIISRLIPDNIKEFSVHTNFTSVVGIKRCEWTIKLFKDDKSIKNNLKIVKEWLYKLQSPNTRIKNKHTHIYDDNPLFLQITSIFSNFNYQIERQIASIIISKNNKRCFSLRVWKSLTNIHINSKYIISRLIPDNIKEFSVHTNFTSVVGIKRCEWTIKLFKDDKSIKNNLKIVKEWLYKLQSQNTRIKNKRIHIYDDNPLFPQITNIFSKLNYQIERKIASIIIYKNNKRCFSLLIGKNLVNIHINSTYFSSKLIPDDIKEFSVHTNFTSVVGINRCEWTIKLINNDVNIKSNLNKFKSWIEKIKI